MGFACTVRYVEGKVSGVDGASLLAFQRAADELRQWRGLRYTDLLGAIEAIEKQWPAAELMLLVNGDDRFRAVLRVHDGRHDELDVKADAARAFVQRAKSAKYVAPPFEPALAPEAITTKLLAELDAPATPPYRRSAIFEQLMQVPGDAIDARLIRAIAEEDARSWVDVAYVCGARATLLPKLLHELRRVWPDPSGPALARDRLIGLLERTSASALGLDATALAELPADLRARLQLRS